MEPIKKCAWLPPTRVTPDQKRRIAAHCSRLGQNLGARVLELIRRDIIAHSHFDLTIEIGTTRKPPSAA